MSCSEYDKSSRRRPRSVLTQALVCAMLTIAFAAHSSDIPQTGYQKREGLEPKLETAIEEFRASVPAKMKDGKIPGIALALVDRDGILWAEGFGVTEYKGEKPVSPDTPFLICGLSKPLTAAAVMMAVQDGLLDLQAPLITYLPDFTVNSRFEKQPERKVTLAHLLSSTAGLPAEASLGNFFEPTPMLAFDEHVKSLYGCWLLSPVGGRFVNGNASFDLAAFCLQVASGRPFEQYMKERLFTPLGMTNSTADRKEILQMKDRAVGRQFGMSDLPAVSPRLGAAGVYSTARDLGRFVQFHLNQGTLEGTHILNETLVDTLHAPRWTLQDPDVFLAFGLYLDKRNPEHVDTIFHLDGWSLGFTSFMHWYPEYGVGMVALANTSPDSSFYGLALGLTDTLVKGKILEKRFPQPHPQCAEKNPAWQASEHHTPTAYRAEWRKYCGTYPLRFTDYKLEWWAKLACLILGRDEWTPRIKVFEKDGYLCLTESSFFDKLAGVWDRHVDKKLEEKSAGLFFAPSGETLDFRGQTPTWRNYRLKD